MIKTGRELALLQEQKGVSDAQLTGDVVTQTKLKTFIAGRSDLKLGEYRRLLANMGVSLRQFASFSERQTMNPSLIAEQVVTARGHEDAATLKELFTLAQQRGQTKSEKLGMVMAAASYEQLTGKRLLSVEDEAAYTEELLRGASWTKVELLTFRVEIATMDASHIFSLTREILDGIDVQLQWNYALYADAWMAVLRALQTLIERRSSFTSAILRQMDATSSLPEAMLQNRLYLMSLRAIFTLQKVYDATAERTLKQAIGYLEELGAKIAVQRLRHTLDLVFTRPN